LSWVTALSIFIVNSLTLSLLTDNLFLSYILFYWIFFIRDIRDCLPGTSFSISKCVVFFELCYWYTRFTCGYFLIAEQFWTSSSNVFALLLMSYLYISTKPSACFNFCSTISAYNFVYFSFLSTSFFRSLSYFLESSKIFRSHSTFFLSNSIKPS
jgi:hypothetical protein